MCSCTVMDLDKSASGKFRLDLKLQGLSLE